MTGRYKTMEWGSHTVSSSTYEEVAKQYAKLGPPSVWKYLSESYSCGYVPMGPTQSVAIDTQYFLTMFHGHICYFWSEMECEYVGWKNSSLRRITQTNVRLCSIPKWRVPTMASRIWKCNLNFGLFCTTRKNHLDLSLWVSWKKVGYIHASKQINIGQIVTYPVKADWTFHLLVDSHSLH